MALIINADKNPSAEGAAARVSRAGATCTTSTDAFTGWPAVGASSHKIVATATTVATSGLPNADRPAAAVGEVWSGWARVRNSAASSRTIAVRVVFYDTFGATLGTALGGSVTTSQTVAAGTAVVFAVNGAVAPAGTASVDLQVERAAGGGAAISDPVHADAHTLTKTAAATVYIDPTTSVFAVWTGTANASTQTYYVPKITLTPLTDANPSPRVQVLVDDLPTGVAKITLARSESGRTFKARGAVNVPVASGFSTLDVEAGFQVTLSYRAQMFSSVGDDLGFTDAASTMLAVTDCWIHNPTDPTGAVIVDIRDDSARSVRRPSDGEVVYPQNRSLGVLIAGPRRGVQALEVFFETADVATADKFQAMLGGYSDDTTRVPVLCIRTPTYLRIPRTFFAAVLDLAEEPVTVHMGGELISWSATTDEVAPPFPGIVVALLTRNDIDAFYSSRNAIDAAYAKRIDIDRDYSKAGTA
jgi:hypothetical protein